MILKLGSQLKFTSFLSFQVDFFILKFLNSWILNWLLCDRVRRAWSGLFWGWESRVHWTGVDPGRSGSGINETFNEERRAWKAVIRWPDPALSQWDEGLSCNREENVYPVVCVAAPEWQNKEIPGSMVWACGQGISKGCMWVVGGTDEDQNWLEN